MAWNVSLQELSIECIRDNEMDSFDRLDLGEPIKAALERNCEAFTVAQVLGQVARQSNSVRTPFKNVGFRVMLLAFFLPEGRHPPPMMRYGDDLSMRLCS